jgi:hypothetical protein
MVLPPDVVDEFVRYMAAIQNGGDFDIDEFSHFVETNDYPMRNFKNTLRFMRGSYDLKIKLNALAILRMSSLGRIDVDGDDLDRATAAFFTEVGSHNTRVIAFMAKKGVSIGRVRAVFSEIPLYKRICFTKPRNEVVFPLYVLPGGGHWLEKVYEKCKTIDTSNVDERYKTNLGLYTRIRDLMGPEAASKFSTEHTHTDPNPLHAFEWFT